MKTTIENVLTWMKDNQAGVYTDSDPDIVGCTYVVYQKGVEETEFESFTELLEYLGEVASPKG